MARRCAIKIACNGNLVKEGQGWALTVSGEHMNFRSFENGRPCGTPCCDACKAKLQEHAKGNK